MKSCHRLILSCSTIITKKGQCTLPWSPPSRYWISSHFDFHEPTNPFPGGLDSHKCTWLVQCRRHGWDAVSVLVTEIWDQRAAWIIYKYTHPNYNLGFLTLEIPQGSFYPFRVFFIFSRMGWAAMSNKMPGCHLANAWRSRSKHIIQWRYRNEVSVQSIKHIRSLFLHSDTASVLASI